MVGALQRIAREAPRVKVTIDRLTESNLENFQRGENEMLLIAEQGAVPNWERDYIFEDDYVCVAWAGNKKIGRSLSLEQYLSMRYVVAKFPSESSARTTSGILSVLVISGIWLSRPRTSPSCRCASSVLIGSRPSMRDWQSSMPTTCR